MSATHPDRRAGPEPQRRRGRTVDAFLEVFADVKGTMVATGLGSTDFTLDVEVAAVQGGGSVLSQQLASASVQGTKDRASQMLSWTAPGGSVTPYRWDAAGNRTRAGDTVSTYDERNRLVSETIRPLPQVLLYTASTNLASSEVAIKDRLQAADRIVTTKRASEGSAADATGKSLIVVSGNVSGGRAGVVSNAGSSVPIVSLSRETFLDLNLVGPPSVSRTPTVRGVSREEGVRSASSVSRVQAACSG